MQKESLKMAIIAGASKALKYRDRNPHASEQEIIQHVNDIADELVGNIEEE